MDDASAPILLSSFFGLKLGLPKPCILPVEYAPVSTLGAYAKVDGSGPAGGPEKPGCAPGWVELGKDIRQSLLNARSDLAASYSPPAAPAAAASAAAFRGRQPPPTESVAAFLAAHHGPFREEDLKRAEAEAREADASGNHGHKKHGHKKHGHKNGVSAATGGGVKP